MAIPSGFFSGLARETIERNEDALLLGSSPDEDSNRPKSDRLGFGVGAAGASCFTAGDDNVGSCGWVA